MREANNSDSGLDINTKWNPPHELNWRTAILLVKACSIDGRNMDAFRANAALLASNKPRLALILRLGIITYLQRTASGQGSRGRDRNGKKSNLLDKTRNFKGSASNAQCPMHLRGILNNDCRFPIEIYTSPCLPEISEVVI